MGRGGDSLDDIVLLVGLGIVGAMGYNAFYRDKSIEAIAADIDTKLRAFIDDIASKLPTLPPIPTFTPPSLIPQSAAEPAALPTNTAPDVLDEPEATDPPVKPKGSGQLTKNPTVPPPPTGSGGAIVAFAGDWRSGSATKAGADLIDKQGASMIIGLGDYSYGPAAQGWFDQFIGARFKGRFKGAIGNHDNNTYLAVFGQDKWTFQMKVAPNLSVVFIDTEKGIDEATLDSLTKAAKAQTKHVAYVFHKPYITAGNKHPPSENKWSAAIDKVAKANMIKLIIAGHNHVYEHSFNGGIHYVTSGAIGADYYSTSCKLPGAVKCLNKTQGFLKVSVGASLLCQFIGMNGNVLDSFTIP